MQKKKILFFIYQLGAGGAARTLLNIVNHLDREKFEPVLVTLNYNGSYERYLKKDINVIKLPTKRLRSAILPLAKVIRREKVDLVFSTIPNYNMVAILARLLSFTKAKNVVREAAFLGGNKKADLKLRLVGMLYKFTSRVIALSKGVKVNIINRYKVNSNDITVIYNPVDIEGIRKQMNSVQIAAEHQAIFDGASKIIITAGRLVKDKDHHTLIQAFAKIHKETESKLVILGEGELEEGLKKLVQELELEDKVFFLGFVNNPYSYFSRSDLFVLSSRREGFGHVLAEALATGLPVVSTRCEPGAVEVLNDGEYGKLCEVGNVQDMAKKMQQVLTLPEQERYEMVNRGFNRVGQFDASEIVRQYEEVFSQALGMTERIKVGAD